MHCRLICIDIDGTLLNDAKEVQEEISRKIRNGEVSDYASFKFSS